MAGIFQIPAFSYCTSILKPYNWGIPNDKEQTMDAWEHAMENYTEEDCLQDAIKRALDAGDINAANLLKDELEEREAAYEDWRADQWSDHLIDELETAYEATIKRGEAPTACQPL